MAEPEGDRHPLASQDSLRTNDEAQLRPADTPLPCTDGLVEHGRRGIDDGIVELCAVHGGLAMLPVELPRDRLVDRLDSGRTDDDIALLAVRCHLWSVPPGRGVGARGRRPCRPTRIPPSGRGRRGRANIPLCLLAAAMIAAGHPRGSRGLICPPPGRRTVRGPNRGPASGQRAPQGLHYVPAQETPGP